MELRRALLLFAIVLGVAAIVTSISNPPDRERDRESEPRPPAQPAPATPSDSPRPGGEAPTTVRFRQKGAARTALVGIGQPVTVTVSVDQPGQIELAGLGLSSPAERHTPARFDVLPSRPGRHPVRFTPAGERKDRTIGELRVVSSR